MSEYDNRMFVICSLCLDLYELSKLVDKVWKPSSQKEFQSFLHKHSKHEQERKEPLSEKIFQFVYDDSVDWTKYEGFNFKPLETSDNPEPQPVQEISENR